MIDYGITKEDIDMIRKFVEGKENCKSKIEEQFSVARAAIGVKAKPYEIGVLSGMIETSKLFGCLNTNEYVELIGELNVLMREDFELE